MVTPEEIKRVTLEHCLGVLKKNEPDHEFKFMISIMEEVHYVRMNRSVNKEIEFTKDIFERVVKKLENKNK